MTLTDTVKDAVSKAPQVTLAFWLIKICATTLGETGGDALSMTLGLGYLASTFLLMGIFLVTLVLQMLQKGYHPVFYWAVILSTTMAGTTLSDFLDRTAHLGYMGGAAVLIGALILVLGAWRLVVGRISFDHICDPRVEGFYWAAILVSNTLGTALGDYLSDNAGLGFVGGAALILGLIAVVLAAWRFTRLPHTLLFWAAFVLTRPLGATVGDLLTKDHAKGGLDLGTFGSSAVLAVAVVGLVVWSSRKPAVVQD